MTGEGHRINRIEDQSQRERGSERRWNLQSKTIFVIDIDFENITTTHVCVALNPHLNGSNAKSMQRS
ncbi:hypothetical protein CEXT_193661 [Caerostris extrusa]|uniref:Uncharacterized protein n=1 Tax=Caerostris extrusa TaxID=172846 RepID=A0AAV4XK09_CAEEX|nr:hypothetical protein CEXT_193661 [Caerostris extrusa]